jgi:GntR family transcriptional regulator/MocR family aminotransferase
LARRAISAFETRAFAWRRATRDPEHIDSLGYRPLRQAICDYVGRLRSMRCDPDQVVIVCGAQQALYLSAHTLLDPGESVWMEDPGYPRARAAFLSAGLKVIPVPVDSEGLVVSAGKKIAPLPRLVFVTPSFQCPLGSLMSLSRRFELLELARLGCAGDGELTFEPVETSRSCSLTHSAGLRFSG